MTYVVAQLGARMHYGVPRALHASGLLERLYTDLEATSLGAALGRVPARLQPAGLRRLAGRQPAGIPADRMTAFAGLGLAYWARQRAARTAEQLAAAHLWAGRSFAGRVAARGFGGARGVYAFTTAALEMLTAARRHGIIGVVEQTVAPWQVMHDILAVARDRYPAWASAGDQDHAWRMFAAREAEEWAEADLIVCGSSFVRDGIAAVGGPVERCAVVPYGVDAGFRMAPRPDRGSPLRVLVLGRVGLRKGAPYVHAAARALAGRAVVRMVGPLDLPASAATRLGEAVELTGPVPRSEVLGHLAWADVFLLPSLCEGSATVTYEAMSAALPVVCTANAGSVVRDGRDGFIVPAHDAEAIVAALDRLAGDVELRRAMAESAAAQAADYGLDSYGRRLLAALGAAGAAPAP